MMGSSITIRARHNEIELPGTSCYIIFAREKENNLVMIYICLSSIGTWKHGNGPSALGI